MKLPANVNADWKMLAVAIVGIVGLYFLAKREVGAAASAVGTAINPTDRNNLAYQAVSGIVAATAGQGNGPKNLGEYIYSKAHPEEWKAQGRTP